MKLSVEGLDFSSLLTLSEQLDDFEKQIHKRMGDIFNKAVDNILVQSESARCGSIKFYQNKLKGELVTIVNLVGKQKKENIFTANVVHCLYEKHPNIDEMMVESKLFTKQWMYMEEEDLFSSRYYREEFTFKSEQDMLDYKDDDGNYVNPYSGEIVSKEEFDNCCYYCFKVTALYEDLYSEILSERDSINI